MARRIYNGYTIEEVKGHFCVTTINGLFICTADTLTEAIDDINNIVETGQLPETNDLLSYGDLHRITEGFFDTHPISMRCSGLTKIILLLNHLNKCGLLSTHKTREYLFKRGY